MTCKAHPWGSTGCDDCRRELAAYSDSFCRPPQPEPVNQETINAGMPTRRPETGPGATQARRRRSQGVPEPSSASTSYGCTPITASVEFWQAEARRVFEVASDQDLMPWAWMLSTCTTDMCINPAHLIVHQPIRIQYPAGVCVYCGMPAGTRDHLWPRGKSGEARRLYVATVPACGDCNCRINDFPDHSVARRREIAQASIRKSKRTLLEAKVWTTDELAEMGRTLRAFIEQKAVERVATMSRLTWPEDPFYDLRAFQKSGIHDPVALGLCDDPIAQKAAS